MSVQNTRAGAVAIARALAGAKKLWFIGIGGIHMASLALFASARFSVAGSDVRDGETIARLRAAGIPVCIGHDPMAASAADAAVYTLAISADDPEYLAIRAAGIPLFSRADFLGFLLAPYKNRVGVAGSHGKSTVTAMLSEIFLSAGRSPTVFCGAPVRALGGAYRAGTGEDALFEACEYEDSFLSLSPTLALTLNIEMDHVDYFADIHALERSFAAFAALPGAGGVHVYCADDPRAVRCAAETSARRVSFGYAADADYRITGATLCNGFGRFRLAYPDGARAEIALSAPGEHNIVNAAAACAAADLCGVSRAAVAEALSAFRGAMRRLEYKGVFFGARFYDDYAHHPTEIRATLRAARLLLDCGGRLFAVFQSHTYSRTAALFGDFCAALSLADRVIVADIYPARETDTLGMSAARLAGAIGANASYEGGFREIAATLAREVSPLDLVVVMGAGDIGQLFAQFPTKGFTRGRESGKIEE